MLVPVVAADFTMKPKKLLPLSVKVWPLGADTVMVRLRTPSGRLPSFIPSLVVIWEVVKETEMLSVVEVVVVVATVVVAEVVLFWTSRLFGMVVDHFMPV